DQEIGSQIGLIFVFFDEITVESSQSLPVNAPDFVSRRIFSMLFKLDTKTLGTATVDSGHHALHHPACSEVEIGDAGQNFGIKVIFGLFSHEADSFLPPPLEII